VGRGLPHDRPGLGTTGPAHLTGGGPGDRGTAAAASAVMEWPGAHACPSGAPVRAVLEPAGAAAGASS